MPTVANKDNKTNGQTEDPQKLVQNLVDKKIRNLEKRKSRLNELKDLEAKGQTLEADQKVAIKKLDQVVEMIDLMKDLSKSICEVLSENTKQQKRLTKKELSDKQVERQQQEMERLKTIIHFQDILTKLDPTVRPDFINGTNGAVKLTKEELNSLDELFAKITDVPESKIESVAEQLVYLADGKSKEAFNGVTFQSLKQLLNKISESKYFSTETSVSATTTTPSTTANTTKQNVVPMNAKNNSSVKNDSTNNTQINSTQFQTPLNTEFNPNPSLIQSQFATGISFMTQDSSLVDKDPAVVAVASVPNTFTSYHSYGLQTTDSLINNSIPDSNPINSQKSANFDTSSMSTIPTQTFTNQHFAALIPGTTSGPVFSAVPVTLAAVSLTGTVLQDMTGQVTADLMGAQTYANQQNFMNSNDKHPNPSHDRGNNEDNYRNNRMRGNRPDYQKKNLNGSGNRPRNPNKGTGYQNPNQGFGNFSNKSYDNQSNGQSFGNNTFAGDKSSNTWNSGSRGRPQQHRQSNNTKPDTRQRTTNPHVNYNQNFNTTAAK